MYSVTLWEGPHSSDTEVRAIVTQLKRSLITSHIYQLSQFNNLCPPVSTLLMLQPVTHPAEAAAAAAAAPLFFCGTAG